MAEFKIAHYTSELLRLLNSENVKIELYEKHLLNNISSHATSQASVYSCVRKLSKRSANAEEFMNKYEDLRSSKGKDIDGMCLLLAKISSDSDVRNLLSRDCKAGAKQNDTEELTVTDISLLKDRLQKEAVQSPNCKLLSVTETSVVSSHKKKDDTTIPKIPRWMTDRPYLTMNFVTNKNPPNATIAELGSIPATSQESKIIDDLLYCLEGIEGDYIHCDRNPTSSRSINFSVDESMDRSLRELTNRILPLCSNYSEVVQFVEERSQFKFGLVNQALCSAINGLIKDYFVLIAQLEHQHRQHLLTLQKMWFYLQPTITTMETLTSITKTIVRGDCCGGAVLSILHNRTISSSGDANIQELCLQLTKAASVPYFRILEKWIYKGLICDPYNEFLIEDNELFQKEESPTDYSNDYWEKRYTICRERVPSFLEKVSSTILRTGKYLNVIRQCDQVVLCPNAEKLTYSIRERQSVDSIEKAYHFASQKLLHYLMKDKDLIGILRSVKHYFLLDQGDFVVQFMDMAEDELKKNIDLIEDTRLESLGELALLTSTANHDIYKDNLRVELLPYNLVFQMSKILSIQTEEEQDFKIPSDIKLSGLEAFSFNYNVKWPLSLILNRKAMVCYQMLFRHLFLSKHVERMLCNVWRNNKIASSFSISSSQQFMSAFALRQRMLYFVQNLEYYMMIEVLEPNWNNFIVQMQNVPNVDDVLKCHTDLIDLCLKDCMLTSPKLLNLVNRIMKTCLSFCQFFMYSQKLSSDAQTIVTTNLIPEEPPTDEDFEIQIKISADGCRSFSSRIEKYDQEFTSLIISLLEGLHNLSCDNYNNKLVNMFYRLDFNGYYSGLSNATSSI